MAPSVEKNTKAPPSAFIAVDWTKFYPQHLLTNCQTLDGSCYIGWPTHAHSVPYLNDGNLIHIVHFNCDWTI